VRVLVVEDSMSLADLVVEGLSDQGIAAVVAYDGTEAASKLGVNVYERMSRPPWNFGDGPCGFQATS
jgi:DNA-binding response OmpR family regulator